MHTTAASVFSRVFGTALPQAGYLPAGGTEGIFARMTGPETVGIIALQLRSGAFPAVYCGIVTVYCRALESACRQQPLSEWLNPLTFYYHAHYPDTWTRETLDRLEGKTGDSPETAARFVMQWTERLTAVARPSTDSLILWNALAVDSIIFLESSTFSTDSFMEETASSVAFWIVPMIFAISSVDSFDASASFLTSSATTANPFPASPA